MYIGWMNELNPNTYFFLEQYIVAIDLVFHLVG